MLCPLLAIASTLDKTGNSSWECSKEKYAWWDYENEECKIQSIGKEVN